MLAYRQLLADHQAGHRIGRLLRRNTVAGNLAVTEHGCHVAQFLDFIQFVADIENTATLSGKLAQRIE
ncbi:hypothetical protein MnTg03_00078 [bacterium MnTg03]|nr:hypothetical protein MnTg03_00078 [bacterium MnTg03]